jgi:hypothetical protein
MRAELDEIKQQDRQIGVQLIKPTQRILDQLDQWEATGIKVITA